jgi:hypothetical protein
VRRWARTDPHDDHRWEAEFYEPKLRTIAAPAQALGVSMEELLYGAEEISRIVEERKTERQPAPTTSISTDR